MKTAIASILTTAAALAAVTCAHADDVHEVTGPYAGIALGASSFSADGAANVDDDGYGSTFRVYGGYQFTDLLGVEAGLCPHRGRLADVRERDPHVEGAQHVRRGDGAPAADADDFRGRQARPVLRRSQRR